MTFLLLTWSQWPYCPLNTCKNCRKPHLIQKWSSFILTHLLNGLKMAIYDPKKAIFVIDMVVMALKSFKTYKSCKKPHLTQKWSLFVLTHILNGLIMAILWSWKCHFCYWNDWNGPKVFKYLQKFKKNTPNTEMIFIYFDPHPKWLKNGHLWP